MIELTRLNNTRIMVNADLIEMIEETPDTVITMTTGRKFVVLETKSEVRDLVVNFKRNIYLGNI